MIIEEILNEMLSDGYAYNIDSDDSIVEIIKTVSDEPTYIGTTFSYDCKCEGHLRGRITKAIDKIESYIDE